MNLVTNRTPNGKPAPAEEVVRSFVADMRVAWKDKRFADVVSVAREILAMLGNHADAQRLGHLSAARQKDYGFITEHLDLLPVDAQSAARLCDALVKARDQAWLASEVVIRLGAQEGVCDPDVRARIADDLFEDAVRARRHGDDALAGQNLRRSIALVEGHAEARSELQASVKSALRVARTQETLAERLIAWQRVLAYAPDSVEALRKTAIHSRDAEDWSRASANWLALLRVAPQDAGGLAQFARAARKAGDAASSLEELARIGVPGDAPELAGLARDARVEARAAHKANDPRRAARHLVALQRLRMLKEGDERLVHATARRLHRIIVAQRESGEMADVFAVASVLAELSPDDETALSALASRARLVRNFKEAERLYARLLQIAPEKRAYSWMRDRVRNLVTGT